ncbi:MAG: hypothetical protein JF631_13765 [Mycobacterium sp.]|nr:hypothetical protein [Mycobacterium sp.]
MTTAAYVDRAGLQIGTELADFIDGEALPVTGVDPAAFWDGLAGLIRDFSPRNSELLETRTTLQAAIDRWHRERAGQPHDASEYRAMLEDIGYLVPVGPAFAIDTKCDDAEITDIAGPQLVVPVTNARYAINAANARWGSLYDALYGTDALGDLPEPPMRSTTDPCASRSPTAKPADRLTRCRPSPCLPATRAMPNIRSRSFSSTMGSASSW